jgi:hypothetical protein
MDQQSLWIRRVTKAIDQHRQRHKALGRSVERLEGQAAEVVRRVTQIKDQIDAEAAEFEKELNTLYERRTDPMVLTGSRSFIYHSADHPCGQAPFYADKLLLSEAHDKGLGPCFNCGRIADREAEKVRVANGSKAR